MIYLQEEKEKEETKKEEFIRKLKEEREDQLMGYNGWDDEEDYQD